MSEGYPGSKAVAGLHEWICEHLADHVYYAEPFVGHGAIFRHKVPALRSWLIDKDTDVLDWWNRRLTREHHQGRRARPSHIELIEGCGIAWMEAARKWVPPEMLVYCDPPYLKKTRVKLDLYRHEMTDREHKRFLLAARALPCMVVVSGYPSALYSEYLADWHLDTRQVITRGGTMRTECLWTNAAGRQASSMSMVYSEFGSDFRTRERVSRKVKRWGAKFEQLPAAERRAILLHLLNAERSACRERSPF